ncbi:MAG: hypothetical protein MRERV_70c004 [Mycoplasmataceae bacterium RV_VA103A]|nr:MAG: hypothetical protein MRERV_70c004 [Mycoplasmataceae bacterium RV_VA103A]
MARLERAGEENGKVIFYEIGSSLPISDQKNCERCKAITYGRLSSVELLVYITFCSEQCLNTYKTEKSAIQEIKNQLQQKGINRVEDLGEMLVEIQALFPWNCQCDHPWTYEYHIKNCLTDAGQIENFKNQYLNIIAKITNGPQANNQNVPPTNPQTDNPSSNNQTPQQDNTNTSQNNEQNHQNREENTTSSDNSNQTAGSSSSDSSSYSPSASSENSGSNNTDTSYASSGDSFTSSSPTSSSSNSNDNNDNSANFKPKAEPTTNQPISSTEPAKVSTDKLSSEKINEIEKKINEAINKPAEQFSEEGIQNTLQELEQFNKDLEQNKDLSQPEREQLQEKTGNLKIDLQIEAIKRIDNQQIQEARQLATEIIKEYIQNKKITDFKEKELVKELETLTTSQAIAHKVQQVINQLKQQKSQNINFKQNLSHQKNKTNYLPWIIGGGLLIFLIGIIVWWVVRKKKKVKI